MNQKPIKLQIDTGSDITIISEETPRKIEALKMERIIAWCFGKQIENKRRNFEDALREKILKVKAYVVQGKSLNLLRVKGLVRII